MNIQYFSLNITKEGILETKFILIPIKMLENKELFNAVLNKVPHQPPFRFIDEITFLDETRIEGNFFLPPDADFYKGHFPGFPVTPGVLLTEIMAQIGLVAFGIYLLMKEGETSFNNMATLLTEMNIRFKKQVSPNQKVWVYSEKILFRHGKLQCEVNLKNQDRQIMCMGTLGGMLFVKK